MSETMESMEKRFDKKFDIGYVKRNLSNVQLKVVCDNPNTIKQFIRDEVDRVKRGAYNEGFQMGSKATAQTIDFGMNLLNKSGGKV